VHGVATISRCPPGIDAIDLHDDGLRCVGMVRAIAYRSQKANSRDRAGATTCFEDDPANLEFGDDACPTKRSEVAVGER
jgi:hypothetical protein